MAAAPRTSTNPCVGVAVHVVRVGDAGPRILFLRRSGGRFAGQWWPVTGTLEPGEDPAACARRELAEETGLEAAALHWTRHTAPVEEGRGHLRIFVAVVGGAAAVRLDWEHDDHRWDARDEALAHVPAFARPTVDEAFRIAARKPAA